MGWVWQDDDNGTSGGADSISREVSRYGRPDASGSGDQCSSRKVVRSQCRTEEVEPGKFIRKCEKTEEIFRSCVGKPVELVQSNTEFTEEDVTDQMRKGHNNMGFPESRPFDFPGLQSDLDAIGHSLFGSLDRFLQAAEEMKSGFFNIFDGPSSQVWDSSPSSSSPRRRGIPVEEHPRSEKPKESMSAHLDVDGLARDV